MHVTAVIVARGGSTRVPGKALRTFGDSTLVGHKIDQLKQCSRIDEIVVGSDDDGILSEAVEHGASIRQRDAYHCDESQCSANEMIRNMVALIETDVVVWAHPTNPLCGPDLYQAAIEAFHSRDANCYDSLCSMTRIQRHAWDQYGPVNFDPMAPRHQPASELPPLHVQDGAIFIQPHHQMLDNAYFYGSRPVRFEIPAPFGWDIDTERDLTIAHHLHRAMPEGVGA